MRCIHDNYFVFLRTHTRPELISFRCRSADRIKDISNQVKGDLVLVIPL